MTTVEPKTALELLALPIRNDISYIERRSADGSIVKIPVVNALQAYFAAENTILRATDSEGVTWALAKEGESWCRHRCT